MKAIVYQRYGSPDVLELRDVEVPEVKRNGVLIRVHAASVNRSDWETLTARPFYVRLGGAGFLRPKQPILGSDVAGRVESVGSEVTAFRPGDEVLGDIMWHGSGAFAEYVCVPDTAPLVPKPAGITFEQAAAIPQAAVLGLQGLREHGGVPPGQRVLIAGAGGGAGSFAVQIAKSLGAEVTGVDKTTKLDMMRSLGADHVVDYTREDFAKSGRRYDRILDFAGRRSLFANRKALRPTGTYLIVGGSMPRLIQVGTVGRLLSRKGGKTMSVLIAKTNKADLSDLAARVAAGDLQAVIDRCYELSEVPHALARVGAGDALGKLVVTI